MSNNIPEFIEIFHYILNFLTWLSSKKIWREDIGIWPKEFL